MSKKIILFSILLVLVTPLTVKAQGIVYGPGGGYTPEGVYYEIYAEKGMGQYSTDSESLYVTRNVVYDGRIQPPGQIFWREQVGSSYYSGTLSLQRYRYSATQTTATYAGTIYQE